MHPVPHGRHFFPESSPPGGPLASGWLSTESVWSPPACPKRWMQDGVPVCSELRRPSGHVFWSSFLLPRPATAPAMFLRPRQQHLGAMLWPLGSASVTRRLQGPRSREGRVPGQGRGISGSRVAFRGPGGDREASARLQEQRGGHRAGAWPPWACGKHWAGWGSSGTQAAVGQLRGGPALPLQDQRGGRVTGRASWAGARCCLFTEQR